MSYLWFYMQFFTGFMDVIVLLQGVGCGRGPGFGYWIIEHSGEHYLDDARTTTVPTTASTNKNR